MLIAHVYIEPVYFYVLVFGFSLVIGSFLNVVIYRLPHMLKREWAQECQAFLQQYEGIPSSIEESTPFNLAWPNSHCPKCQHPLSALENIPIVSYILQRGRCKHCNSGITIRYPFVEILTGLVSLLVVFKFGATWACVFALLLTYGLIAQAFIDNDHQILPDTITLPLLWLGLLVNTQSMFASPVDAIIGASAGYMSLWLVYQVFKLLTKKEGMGFGDFKLLALFGAWLGWQVLPLILLFSAVLGSVVGISLILFKGHDRANPIPFGPYLALAGWIALLWGDTILTYYLQFLGLHSPL